MIILTTTYIPYIIIYNLINTNQILKIIEDRDEQAFKSRTPLCVVL